MTEIEFRRLSEDIRLLAKSIQLNWGAIQNNKYDHLLNMFSIDTYSELESSLVKFSEPIQVYFKRRWYLWKCAQCDEYLFYKNQNVEKNPNPRDQSYDICIDGVYYFDIKGTVIPKSMRNQNIDNIIDSPQEMVDFYYDKQSRGVRNCYQNRLFVVHHSFVDPAREFYLRCAWGNKG